MMEDGSQTTANPPTEPKLCRMGCGFFGSDATGDCCSKCWNEKQKKEQATSPICPEIKKSMDVVAEEPSPMEVEPTATEEALVEASKKPKKKKASYKSMMAGMTKGATTKDISQEKERLRQVTGGGAFAKIDKI